jgi:trigger factor
VHGGDAHPNPAVRNKDAQVEITLKDLKRLELATIDQDFLDGLGFAEEKELRDALREQMVERINYDVQQAMHEQVKKHLLDQVQMELPTRLSTRQEERVVGRRAMELMSRGISREQIEANLERLRTGARDEAVRELKLFFILQQIANEQKVDVDEGELNGRIALLAAQRGRRPEKMKQDMAKDGSLTNLYIQMREQKALDKVLEDAQIEEVEMKPEEAKAAGEAGTAASAGGESSST